MGRSSMPLANWRMSGAWPPSISSSNSKRRAGDLTDVGQSGGIQPQAGFGPMPGSHLFGSGCRKSISVRRRDFQKRGGFVQFGRDLADELVGTQSLAHGNFQPLGDGLADDLRDFTAGF